MKRMYPASSGSNMNRAKGPTLPLWAFVWLCGLQYLKLRLNHSVTVKSAPSHVTFGQLVGQKNELCQTFTCIYF